MIDSKEYVSIAIKEIKQPTFEVTKQYLKVICVELNSTIPRVARVDLDHSCETVAVYFFIRGERFFS